MPIKTRSDSSSPFGSARISYSSSSEEGEYDSERSPSPENTEASLVDLTKYGKHRQAPSDNISPALSSDSKEEVPNGGLSSFSPSGRGLLSFEDEEQASTDTAPECFTFDPGMCEWCEQPEDTSPSSLHSYLLRDPKREALAGSEKDPQTFQWRINEFFTNSFNARKGPNLDFLAPCIDACNLRRFFITDDQRIGIGPQAMCAGDIVADLVGATFPYVLRKAKGESIEPESRAVNTGDFYHLIGECYIQEPCNVQSDLKPPDLVEYDLI